MNNPEITFQDLGLSESTIQAVTNKGFTKPTAIQKLTIPIILQNNTNIIAQAQTGTGKTAAFGLPLLETLDVQDNSVQALVLAPTRELAIQVADEMNSLKHDKNIKILPVYGGQSMEQQLRQLKRGVHVVVGTPGRVIDHLNRKTLKIQNIKQLVLDEADEMLNMGFAEDVEKVLQYANKEKRMIMFSATMPQRIQQLAKKYMGDYELLSAKKEQLTTNLTEQMYLEVRRHDKPEALCRIIDIQEDFYGMIFCKTKMDVDETVGHLVSRGYNAEAIHGDISQAQREKTLKKFKQKKQLNILVATDVAARGIDVNNLTHVVNYSIPQELEAYVHRIGRTGRAGNKGTAITFVLPSEEYKIGTIQRIAKANIKKISIPSIDEVIKSRKQNIYDSIARTMESEIENKFYSWAKTLLDEGNNPTEVLAGVLSHCFEEKLNTNNYQEIRKTSSSKEKRTGRREKNQDNSVNGKARLFVALGQRDKYNAKKLVDLVSNKISMKSSLIQEVQVKDNFSFMTVPSEKAESIINNFKEKGKKPLVTYAKARD